MTECLTPGSLGDISWVQKAVSQLYIRNLPLLHMSTQHPGTSLHVISFTSPSLAFVLQAANARLKRHGYEAPILRQHIIPVTLFSCLYTGHESSMVPTSILASQLHWVVQNIFMKHAPMYSEFFPQPYSFPVGQGYHFTAAYCTSAVSTSFIQLSIVRAVSITHCLDMHHGREGFLASTRIYRSESVMHIWFRV